MECDSDFCHLLFRESIDDFSNLRNRKFSETFHNIV